MGVSLLRRLFTVEEFYEMARAGILTEDDRVELLEGEIVERPPIGSPHAGCVIRLNRWFSRHLANQALVSVQNPVRLGERSEPQPDVALLLPRADCYGQSHPEPQDVLLIVEVAETSADIDREIKVPLYARSGIPEVWLVNLAGGCVEIYRTPSSQGYGDKREVRIGERISPLKFPDVHLAVDDILT